MIKAMLIVYGIVGMDPYQVSMETMESCKLAAIQVKEQDYTLRTLCVPKADKSAEMKNRMNDMISTFVDMIGTLKHKVCVEQPFAEGCGDGSISR